MDYGQVKAIEWNKAAWSDGQNPKVVINTPKLWQLIALPSSHTLQVLSEL